MKKIDIFTPPVPSNPTHICVQTVEKKYYYRDIYKIYTYTHEEINDDVG